MSKKDYGRGAGSSLVPRFSSGSEFVGEDWVGRGDRVRNERDGRYPDWCYEGFGEGGVENIRRGEVQERAKRVRRKLDRLSLIKEISEA